MAYQNDFQRPQRQMHDISSLGIKCSECGSDITELPFEPTKRDDGTFGNLYCYECNKKRKRDSGPRRGFGGRNRY